MAAARCAAFHGRNGRSADIGYHVLVRHLLGVDAGINALVGEVIPTRVRLTFSQAQNMIADIAIERNYTFYFWGHSDVALLASNATAVFAEEVRSSPSASRSCDLHFETKLPFFACFYPGSSELFDKCPAKCSQDVGGIL